VNSDDFEPYQKIEAKQVSEHFFGRIPEVDGY
jgi:hypothetical protein